MIHDHDQAADMRQFWPITVMTHANELLEWLVNTMTNHFGVQVAQLWKYQLQNDQQNRPELLALASANTPALINVLASSPVATLVELIIGSQNHIAPQPVYELFPSHIAILLRRRGLTYCAGYCVETDLDLPLARTSRLTRSKLVLLLFFGGPPQGSLAEIRSFLEQSLALGEKRSLLRIHHPMPSHESTIRFITAPLPSNNAVDCYNKGNALFAQEYYQEALMAYEQTLSLDPNYLAAYDRKGDTLVQLKREEEAQEAYKQSVLRSNKRIR